MCRGVHLTDTSGQHIPGSSQAQEARYCAVACPLTCIAGESGPCPPDGHGAVVLTPPAEHSHTTPDSSHGARARLCGLLPTPHAAGCKLSTPAQARSVGFPRSCPTHHRPPSTMQHVAVIIVHRVAVDWRYRLPVARIFRPAYALPAPPPPTPVAPPTPPTPNQPRSHAKGVSAVQHASAQAAHTPRATHARRLSGRPIYIAKPGYSSV